MRNPTNMILIVIGVLFAAGAVIAVQLIVPQFEDVFRNFGADLPLLSRVFVEGRAFLWVLPLLVSIVAVLVRPRSDGDMRPGIVALLTGLVIGIGLPMACMLAMYLPIFGLAAAVK